MLLYFLFLWFLELVIFQSPDHKGKINLVSQSQPNLVASKLQKQQQSEEIPITQAQAAESTKTDIRRKK